MLQGRGRETRPEAVQASGQDISRSKTAQVRGSSGSVFESVYSMYVIPRAMFVESVRCVCVVISPCLFVDHGIARRGVATLLEVGWPWQTLCRFFFSTSPPAVFAFDFERETGTAAINITSSINNETSAQINFVLPLVVPLCFYKVFTSYRQYQTYRVSVSFSHCLVILYS